MVVNKFLINDLTFVQHTYKVDSIFTNIFNELPPF